MFFNSNTILEYIRKINWSFVFFQQAIKQLKPSPTKPLQAYNSPAGPLINMSVINKAPHSPRRVRGETKKCRKVYGMEHRDLWCTQCKWKKACTRFNDNNQATARGSSLAEIRQLRLINYHAEMQKSKAPTINVINSRNSCCCESADCQLPT